MNNDHSPALIINRIKLIIVKDKKSIEQSKLDEEIEKEEVFYEWGSVGLLFKQVSIINTNIIKYRDSKVARFPQKGNVLLCKINGCFNAAKEGVICATHIKDINKLDLRFCTYPDEICKS